MNKENKHNYVMPFPCWLAQFVPHAYYTPQGYVIKPGKNDRLIFDGSHLLTWDSLPVNLMTNLFNEPEIVYNQTWDKHLSRIWNLCISYPMMDILLFDDDVAGAFRTIKKNPEIASVFSFIIDQLLFVPTGMTFGSNTSPSNWEPIARAQTILAEWLFDDPSLREKHKDFIDKVKFGPEPDHATQFEQAVKDTLNQGVIGPNGTPNNTPHNMFVDDNLIA